MLVKARNPSDAYDRCDREMSRVCNGGDYIDADDESIRDTGSYGGILSIHVIVEQPGDLSEVYSLKEVNTPEEISDKIRSRDEVIDSADPFGG